MHVYEGLVPSYFLCTGFRVPRPKTLNTYVQLTHPAELEAFVGKGTAHNYNVRTTCCIRRTALIFVCKLEKKEFFIVEYAWT